MIVIDETKLTNGTLTSILMDLGVDIEPYWESTWTDEEIKEKVTDFLNRYPEEKEFVKQYEASLRITKFLNYERLFEDKLVKLTRQDR